MNFSRRGVMIGLWAIVPLIPTSLLAQTPAPARPPSGLSADDQRLVERAIAYLEGLTTAEARFVQTGPRGAASPGTVYLQRPGRARFDYDPPSGLQIASDGHEVMVVDHRLATIRSYPLGLTPLSLFLARDIRLDRGVRVIQVLHEASGFTIVAQDAHPKSRGAIALTFREAPLALTGWTVTDARGAQVKVRLEALSPGHARPPEFFVLADPAARPRSAEVQ